MSEITTNQKYNFTKAESDLFSWSMFDGTSGNMLLHKPSGKSIYQMRWIGSDHYMADPVTGETREAAIKFWDTLREMQKQKPQTAKIDYVDDEPKHGQNGYCRKCHSYCWGDCEA